MGTSQRMSADRRAERMPVRRASSLACRRQDQMTATCLPFRSPYERNPRYEVQIELLDFRKDLSEITNANPMNRLNRDGNDCCNGNSAASLLMGEWALSPTTLHRRGFSAACGFESIAQAQSVYCRLACSRSRIPTPGYRYLVKDTFCLAPSQIRWPPHDPYIATIQLTFIGSKYSSRNVTVLKGGV